MEQYISKAALVAEIEKLKEENKPNSKSTSEYIKGGIYGFDLAIEKTFSILNTLEVKEVDIEKELDTWRHNHFHGRRDKDASGEYLERSSQLDIAKHFFELGIKAQKGE